MQNILDEKIKKIREDSNAAGVSIIYVDKGNEQADTVNIYIPKDSISFASYVSKELQRKDEKLHLSDTTKSEESLALIAEIPHTQLLITRNHQC